MSEKEKESEFNGGLIGWAWVNAVFYASIVFTFGILSPFALCYRERWLAKHTKICGKQLEFYGNSVTLFLKTIAFLVFGPMLIGLGIGLFFAFFGDQIGGDNNVPILGVTLVPLLTLLAFALFSAWITRRMRKWITKHTRFA